MKTQHSMAQLCAALDVTRSGYHAWHKAGASPRQTADITLLAEVRQIHAEHRQRYGAPRIQRELRHRGQRHGTKRIARLRRSADLRGRTSRTFVPRTTDSGPVASEGGRPSKFGRRGIAPVARTSTPSPRRTGSGPPAP